MSFCIRIPNLIKSLHWRCRYDVTSIFKDGDRCGSILLPVAQLLMSVLQKVKLYHQTKCRRHISIHGCDITFSVLEKETFAILEFYFRFWFQLYYHYRHVVFYQPSKYHLHLYRTTYCGNITSYQFFKMAATAAQYYFRFRICWCQCLQKVNIYHQTKFHRHTSIRCWYITTSVFEKQTSAILEFYFRLRSIPFFRNLCVILHQATKFCPNRSTHCRNMTSYPFLKMAAAAAEYYFRFRIFWCQCLQKVKVYHQTEFRWHISIHGWDIITTSGLEKQTSATLVFYFRFWSRPFRRKCRVILHVGAEFRPNRTMRCGIMTSYRFSRWRQLTILYLIWGNSRPPTKRISWSELGLQIACLSD